MPPFEPPIDYWVTTEVGRRVYELKAAAGFAIRSKRQQLGLSQQVLAQRLCTSQSRVSQLERGCGHTTLDFAVATLVALGATNEEIAATFTAADGRADWLRGRARRIPFLNLKRRALREQIQTKKRARPSGRGQSENDG